MKESSWARLLAYVTGRINQDLLVKNEYLAAENCILRAQLPARLRLSDPERSTLADIGKRLGRKALAEVACVAKPDTILAWYRRLIAKKFDGSKLRRYPGRPPIEPKLEELIVKMARENSGWGYDRIMGALANLGYTVSDQIVGNVLRRYGIAPARNGAKTQRGRNSSNRIWPFWPGSTSLLWRSLLGGLVTYYVLFFIHLESRRVSLAGITRHPDQPWMQLMARNATVETWGIPDQRRYALHDRDTKFCSVFRETLKAGGIEPIQLPARSPNLNCYAERWIRSAKSEALSKLILFGEASLRRAVTAFIDHYHAERNHQGKGNVLLFPSEEIGRQKPRSRIRCREHLGGL